VQFFAHCVSLPVLSLGKKGAYFSLFGAALPALA
jgi:hypothetical protein